MQRKVWWYMPLFHSKLRSLRVNPLPTSCPWLRADALAVDIWETYVLGHLELFRNSWTDMKWQKGPNSQKYPTVLAAEFRELTSTFQYCHVFFGAKLNSHAIHFFFTIAPSYTSWCPRWRSWWLSWKRKDWRLPRWVVLQEGFVACNFLWSTLCRSSQKRLASWHIFSKWAQWWFHNISFHISYLIQI